LNPSPRPNPISLRQTIPSSIEEAESLCRKIRSLLQEGGLPYLCFAVELLARECLANAVVHGNRNAADKSIDLRLDVGRKWVRLEVCDEGPGFAWREARQKTPCTTSCSGRGLQLYALYAERVQFNRSGNRIALWIRKTSEQERKAAKWPHMLSNRMTSKVR